MKKDTYEKMTQPFRDNPKLAKSVHNCNRILTALVFAAYPLLLVWLLLHRAPTLYLSVVVPLDSFLIISVFRHLVNRPRPYEKFALAPVIPKDTHGKSFPSRHVFSAAVIAVTFLVQQGTAFAIIGAALLVCAVLLGVIRVVSGVHYISDVVAALAFAGIGWASYYIWL